MDASLIAVQDVPGDLLLEALPGAIAHEINQPLTAILTNAIAARRFIDQGAFDVAQLREILCDIANEGQRAGEIIRHLRTLIRPGQAMREPLDVGGVVTDTLQLLSRELEIRQVAVETNLAADLPAVQADRVQLQQVLTNLVMNACDAMNGIAAPERRLRIGTSLAPGPSVRVSVSDDGTGIAPALLSRIFDSFFTTKAQGMGLGLAVCSAIVRAHDGQLWAENNLERGATFRIVLPALPESMP